MTLRIPTLFRKPIGSILLPLMLCTLASTSLHHAAAQAANDGDSQSRLVQIVQTSTRQYADVNAAVAGGYTPFLGCVSGPDHGAMGIHYVNGALLNGVLDATRPQALIYEPSEGKLRLVGVEFILFQDAWDASHNNVPPILNGQSFQFVAAPNRFNIPAFYELHVWAWRNNPLGAYVDWNTKVSCAGQ